MSQFYEAFGLDEETWNLIASDKLGLLEGAICSICNRPFETDEEKDNAMLSQVRPLRFAHEECWEGGNDDLS